MNDDAKYAQMALDEAARSLAPHRRLPHVGAVVVHGERIVRAHRSELAEGDHAEFTALEKKTPNDPVAGATVYTTLEPCTKRGPDKTPCAQRLIERKVARVVIGMLDPNPDICGRGILALRNAGIDVDLFPSPFKARAEEQNRKFIAFHSAGGAAPEQSPTGLRWTNPPTVALSGSSLGRGSPMSVSVSGVQAHALNVTADSITRVEGLLTTSAGTSHTLYLVNEGVGELVLTNQMLEVPPRHSIALFAALDAANPTSPSRAKFSVAEALAMCPLTLRVTTNVGEETFTLTADQCERTILKFAAGPAPFGPIWALTLG